MAAYNSRQSDQVRKRNRYTKIRKAVAEASCGKYEYGAIYNDLDITIDCLSMVSKYLKTCFNFSMCLSGFDFEECYKRYLKAPNDAILYGSSFLKRFFEHRKGLASEGDIIIVEPIGSSDNKQLGVSVYLGYNRMLTVYEHLGSAIVSSKEYKILEVIKCHKPSLLH